ncbi:hypothetical protein [Georgenia daeguensis]
MKFYADQPSRRARQVAGDVLVAVWLAMCTVLGMALHALLEAGAAPLRRVADVGAAIEDGMGDAGRGAGELPLLGERLRQPFDDVADSGARLQEAGADGAVLVETLAVLVAVLVAVMLSGVVLLPWLALRVRYAAGAGAVRCLQAQPGGADLLALRALASRPPAVLSAVGPAPAAAWRAGDPVTTARLAEVELGHWGVAPRTADERPGA